MKKCLKNNKITEKEYFEDVNKSVTTADVKANKCSYFCEYVDSGYLTEDENFEDNEIIAWYTKQCGGHNPVGDKCQIAFLIRLCTDKIYAASYELKSKELPFFSPKYWVLMNFIQSFYKFAEFSTNVNSL